MKKVVFVVLVGALVCGACSSSGSSGSSSGTAATTVPAATSAATNGVVVPDAFTPVIVAPVSKATTPVKGTDGKLHVVYDLQLTNASRVPATIDKVQVVDAHATSRVLATYTGKQLVDPTCDYGNCNRLRQLPSFPADSTTIPPQEGRSLLIDFTVPSGADSPSIVLHRLSIKGAKAPAAKDPTPITEVVAPYDISNGTARVLGAPLRGNRWVALNGCCQPGFPHRTSLNSFNGRLTNSQRYAIDFKQLDAQGRFVVGDKTKNSSYVDYGAKVYAVADGTVVSTLDTEQANQPGILPASDPARAARITAENVDGNHIVLDIGGGDYVMYGHLLKGSLLVKKGDKVTKGQVIAQLGNTGNSNASHLHFQVMDNPSLLEGDGIPYVFDHFQTIAQVSPNAILNADDFLSGVFVKSLPTSGTADSDELPLLLSVLDFGNGNGSS